MSTTTENYKLMRLELDDPADITVLNTNWDKIDEELHKVNEALDNVSPDYIIEQNAQKEQKFWVGTKAQYDAIAVKDPNTSYTVTDDNDETELEQTVEAISQRTTALEARNNVRFESWETTIANNGSNTHQCGGTVVMVIVAARYNDTGSMVTGMWTPATSGIENTMYGKSGNGTLDHWSTTVSITGKNVTVTRGASGSVTYYCTAVIV